MAINPDPISAERLLQIFRDMQDRFPFIRREVTFGSTWFIKKVAIEPPAPRREVDLYRGVASDPPRFAGIPFKISPLMPPYAALMKETNGSKVRFYMFDLRRRPVTDDMAQMVDDLRRVGGVR